MDLGITIGSGLLEEVLDERANEAGHVADIEGEARASDLHAALEVDGLIEPGNIPVSLGGRGDQLCMVAPFQDDLIVGLGPAFGHGVVRDIGDGKRDGLHLLLGFRDLLLQLLHLGGSSFHLGELGLEFRGALRHRGHLLVRGVLRGAGDLELGHRVAAGFVGGQHGVEVDLELLPGDALADEVDVFAEELRIQHRPTLPNSPAQGQRGIIGGGGLRKTDKPRSANRGAYFAMLSLRLGSPRGRKLRQDGRNGEPQHPRRRGCRRRGKHYASSRCRNRHGWCP